MISPSILVSSPKSSALRIPPLRRSPSFRVRPSLLPRCVRLDSQRCAASAAETTLYDVLGIPAAASGGEIKSAYRRLARAYHPDAVAVERKGASADVFMRVHAAYATLSDPERRAEYDRAVMFATAAAAGGRQRLCRTPLPRGYRPFYASRTSPGTWETDQCW